MNYLSIQNIAIIISSVIAAISLIISVKTYYIKKPKLKIEITNKKDDCFFGVVCTNENYEHFESISGVYLNIVNNSPVAITISSLKIKIGNAYYRLINNSNPFWGEIEFAYPLSNNKYSLHYDASISYKDTGIVLPIKINPYDTLSFHALFYHFPNNIHNTCKATLIVQSAVGTIKKRVSLHEVTRDYNEIEWKEVQQFYKSHDNLRNIELVDSDKSMEIE